jgi:hypothetical protein
MKKFASDDYKARKEMSLTPCYHCSECGFITTINDEMKEHFYTHKKAFYKN